MSFAPYRCLDRSRIDLLSEVEGGRKNTCLFGEYSVGAVTSSIFDYLVDSLRSRSVSRVFKRSIPGPVAVTNQWPMALTFLPSSFLLADDLSKHLNFIDKSREGESTWPIFSNISRRRRLDRYTNASC